MTDDLVAFLRARLDEDDRVARAACWDDQSAEWTARPPQASYERYTVVDYLDDGVVAVTPENADDDGVGQHIARWDPARVLAEVDAKRLLIKLHGPVVLRGGAGERYYDTTTVCRSCEPPRQFPERAFPCPTLRLLAAPYRDHPDYRPEWAPGA